MELPAADGGVEARARARRAATPSCSSRPRPRRSPRCCSPTSARRPSCRPASSTSSPARARPARRWSSTPASTRSRSPARPRSARASSGRWPAPASSSRSSSAARRPTSSSTTPPIDQAVEGIVNGIYFNQGHVCCAGSRLLVQESVADPFVDRLKRRLGTLRVGDPLDKNTDIGAINSAEQLDRIAELVEAGDAEGAEMWQPRVPAARAGLVASGRRSSPACRRRTASPGRRSSGRCCRCSRSAPPTRRWPRPTTRRTGCRPACGPRRGARILWMAAAAAGRGGVGQHVQPLRPGEPVRRLQGVGLRAGGRPPRPAAVPATLGGEG